MAKIEIVSASAGSGKTWTITELVIQRLKSKELSPEGLVATTFTNKAADELKQRIRSRLFAEGMTEEAQRLEGARIGTVNSVCGRLLQEFAFELGLSPVQRVIEEEAALMTLRRAASRVVTSAELEVLTRCEEVFEVHKGRDKGGKKGWQAEVAKLIDLARANRVPSTDFANCAERSVMTLRGYLEEPTTTAKKLERAFIDALEAFLEHVGGLVKVSKTTDKYVPEAHASIAKLRRGAAPWSEWMRWTKARVTKDSTDVEAKIIKAASRFVAHPALHDDLRQYITLIFDIAARSLDAYTAEKAAWGVVDFVDQEARALELLERSDVAERLRGELELVVVDEFQDTSPIQLALFARLSALAKQSMWVGDPKQAIFGFRGTDPSLMESALKALSSEAKLTTLGTSYRSRAPLVELTSALFAPPFGAAGLSKERVVLEPKEKADPPALGPCVESWTLDATNKEKTALALAHCVSLALDDGKLRVRDRDGGEPRALRSGDLAILCRTNARCRAVADALAARGYRVAVERPGLLSTPEAQLGLAALRLFVDPRDKLAAAELALLQAHAGDPDGWLDAVLKQRERDALVFAELPMHAQIEAARARQPAAGPLVAFDGALEALDARETCLRWGRAAERHANLDALRAHAVGYARACEVEGAAATPAGLLAFFDELAGSDDDQQAMVTGGDAINVLTWHRSKGLEWPVVVLDGLHAKPKPRLWGASAQSDARQFDFHAPLEKRWLRFWPKPFGAQKTSSFHTLIEAGAEGLAAQALAEREDLRLLYVGWTRARDRLVLALKGGNYAVPQLAQLTAGGARALTPPDDKGACTWAGRKLAVKVRVGAPEEPAVRSATPDAAPVPAGERVHPPAWLSPSKLGQKGEVGAPVKIGERRKIVGSPDMDQLGTALHAFLAADVEGLSQEQRALLAARCLKNRDVEGALAVEDVVAMGDALRKWASEVAPGAVWRREWPVWRVMEDGSVVRGTADLVLERADGVVLVDHKSFPGRVEDALERAAGHAAQLAAYVGAIEDASQVKVVAAYVHLPLIGVAVGRG